MSWCKRLVSLVLAGSSAVTANMTRVQANFNDMLDQFNAGRNGRNLPQIQMNETFYGCHCRNFNKRQVTTDIMLATRGKPVDDVDKACMYLHNGWSCLSAVDGCNLNINYASPAVFNFIPWQYDDGMQQCQDLNAGDSCAQNLCKVELFFNLSLFNLMFAGRYDAFMTDAEGFSAVMECPIMEGGCDSRKCCVDDYPMKDVTRVCKPSSCPN